MTDHKPMRPDLIEQALKQGLPGVRVQVDNPSGDGMHFIADVRGPLFAGKSRIDQHRLVYAALEPVFANGLHGLKLTTGVE